MAAAAAAADGAEEPGMEAEAQELPLGCGGGAGVPAAGRSPEGEQRPEPPQASVSNGGGEDSGRELVELKVIWNKNKYDVKFCLDSTGAELKQKIHSLTGLPPAMQKVMFKGLLPEEKTLREIKVTNGAKIMVVGSTINDVLAVNTPKEAAQQEVKAEENKKEPLCRQKQHRKVLDKGKPDDVMPSVKGVQERLPTVPLSGMYNKSGGKVRLTFKLEQDQLWIGTKGISAGPNRSILLLGLLGPNSVCRCNQRHGAGEVAVFLKARSPLAQENDTNLRTLLGEASNIPGCDSPGTYY
ncbi:PREDICTED: ubiquitin domain-containing protein UBFD1 isoform X1 [Pseudopodoces humilis]|uniref:ubiquitin domain-containing protein UBFD1 isoform X1 n=1 Tax=Pseudopodoces humilis TaxID=181119 RepID=UPI0006B79A25|nr:PREDICTED: ubiquitin domain-containing protein UBFD1 isoform X1 [Pseudopodoces humilis]